jgi:hypothetical protein
VDDLDVLPPPSARQVRRGARAQEGACGGLLPVGLGVLDQHQHVLWVEDAGRVLNRVAADVEFHPATTVDDAVLIVVECDCPVDRPQSVLELHELDLAVVAERDVEEDREDLGLEEIRLEPERGEDRGHKLAAAHPLLVVLRQHGPRDLGHRGPLSSDATLRSDSMK